MITPDKLSRGILSKPSPYTMAPSKQLPSQGHDPLPVLQMSTCSNEVTELVPCNVVHDLVVGRGKCSSRGSEHSSGKGYHIPWPSELTALYVNHW